MNDELLELLRCPRCRAALEPTNDPPALRCRACGAVYPVVGGVARLAGEAYVESFGRQWNRYDVARDEEDEATFTVKTGIAPRSVVAARGMRAVFGPRGLPNESGPRRSVVSASLEVAKRSRISVG